MDRARPPSTRIPRGDLRPAGRSIPAFLGRLVLLAALAAGGGCEDLRPDGAGPPGDPGDGERARIEAAFERTIERITARSDSIDDVFQPLPFLTDAERRSFLTYRNEEHVARARALGISPSADSARLLALEEEGRLVRVADTTQLWIVRDLDYSVPLLTPDAHAMLEELAGRFQARLDSLGAPRFRLEVTSMLRTAENQEALRAVNPNATDETSSHQFGTTLDIAYSGYAPPAEPIVAIDVPEADWLEGPLRQVADWAAATVAARRSGELQAVLGRVLREMQEEGKLMGTLERRQPVYHLTVARRYGSE